MPEDQPTDQTSNRTSTPDFKALKTVSYFTAVNLFPFVESYRQQQQPRFHDFLWLFYLPSIERIRAMAVETSLPLSWPEKPPTASSLTILHLLKSHVDEETLGAIFGALPSLKTFEHNFACDDESCYLRRGAYLDCNNIRACFAKAENNLGNVDHNC